MLWYSAPTSLNNNLLNDGVILENYHETVNIEDEYAKSLFHEVNTCNVGTYD